MHSKCSDSGHFDMAGSWTALISRLGHSLEVEDRGNAASVDDVGGGVGGGEALRQQAGMDVVEEGRNFTGGWQECT